MSCISAKRKLCTAFQFFQNVAFCKVLVLSDIATIHWSVPRENGLHWSLPCNPICAYNSRGWKIHWWRRRISYYKWKESAFSSRTSKYCQNISRMSRSILCCLFLWNHILPNPTFIFFYSSSCTLWLYILTYFWCYWKQLIPLSSLLYPALKIKTFILM